MSGPTQSTYTSLITSEHADKPNFMATVAALVQPFVDAQTVLSFLASEAFDIDQAVGVQLDQVGLWVGRSRFVSIPLAGVYFSLDDANLGFDQGNWQGQFDPVAGVVVLDDDTYRALLFAKIIMNTWDGSANQAAEALDQIFRLSPGTFATIQDNFDMTMTVGVSGVIPPASVISLVTNNEFDVRPVGVGINYFVTSVNTRALFGLDIQDSSIAGFDTGAWSGQPGTIPGPVISLTASFVTANAATITWLAPLSGVGPYSYQLLYTITGSNTPFSYAPVVNTTSTTISGLNSETSYTVLVYAISSVGPGPDSDPLVFSTTMGVPAQVIGLIPTGADVTSISIAWTAVAGAVSYQILYRVNGTPTFVTGPTTASTSITIIGLAVATIYDITVFAINTIGQGPDANILTVGTSGSVPGVVTNLTTINVGELDIGISWFNPATGNGPFAFLIQYAIDTVPITYQQFSGTINLSAIGGSCDIPNLAAGTQYLIEVAATNLGGSGPFSQPLVVTTTTGPPNQVQNLTPSVVNPSSITLQWSPVVNAVTYQMQYQLMGASIWSNGPLISVPNVSGTITGLQPGFTYNFRVYAIGP